MEIKYIITIPLIKYQPKTVTEEPKSQTKTEPNDCTPLLGIWEKTDNKYKCIQAEIVYVKQDKHYSACLIRLTDEAINDGYDTTITYWHSIRNTGNTYSAGQHSFKLSDDKTEWEIIDNKVTMKLSEDGNVLTVYSQGYTNNWRRVR